MIWGEIMVELKLDSSIDILVSAINNNNKNLDVSVSSINSPSKCSGIMIFSYVDRIKKISKLLESYKQLLKKDALDIKTSKNKIVEMDRNITSLYHNTSSK